MKKTLIFLLSFIFFLSCSSPLYAAQFYTGETVTLSKDIKNAEDVYLFGSTIKTNTLIRNDAVVAGGDIVLSGETTGSVLAAGGKMLINTKVGNTIRAAGGTVVISQPVMRDAVVFAGNLIITDTASIGGDLIFTGGNLTVRGNVLGNVMVNSGDAIINSTVGKNVQGRVGTLTLGNNAVINGNLSYSSSDKATIREGAKIKGKQTFRQIEDRKARKGLAAFLTVGSLMKLFADIIFGLLLVVFLNKFVLQVFQSIRSQPLRNGGIGFLFLFLTPLLSLFLLLTILLGIASFLFYGIVLIVTLVLGKIFVGYEIVSWWEKRNKKDYLLNWKAVVIGPITIFLLWLIPGIGGIIAFLLYLVTLGAIIRVVYVAIREQKTLPLPKTKNK